jgi:hypothetical protein
MNTTRDVRTTGGAPRRGAEVRRAARTARSLPAWALAVSAVLLLGGCFNPFAPRVSAFRGVSEPPPVPNSARAVLELFRWCWENRAIDEYREIFTDDYTFQFSERDSAGNAFRDRPWIREDEMVSATNLFVGGSATEPPASRITLDFENTLREFADSRPGKDPRYHKEIRAEVNLRVNRGESTFEVRGPGLFFLVRGDSAAIPEELQARGFGPDSTRWYIERWVDETVPEGTPGTFAARPARAVSRASAQDWPVPVSWGAIKAAARQEIP